MNSPTATASVGVYCSSRSGSSDWPTAAAALTISLVPLLVLVGLLHRLFERFSLLPEIDRDAI